RNVTGVQTCALPISPPPPPDSSPTAAESTEAIPPPPPPPPGGASQQPASAGRPRRNPKRILIIGLAAVFVIVLAGAGLAWKILEIGRASCREGGGDR